MNKNNNKTTEMIQDRSFAEVLGEKYLAYALSTIMSRSLPDVRDGLKPVHRRLLYAMQQLRLRPEEAYKKCARVVGDVIGKYHPHGDVAVYDTLVRLAQHFSLRYPLIDGQGNFGSVDGDNAAAMRYTESRLTPIAMKLMEDLEKDTVPFRATYDDSDEEPALFPSKFPNLLANGSEGIAVGMATSIPPHNLEELCLAAMHLIDNKDCSANDLANMIEGPDFPTGGVIYDNRANIISIYETGKGSIKVRAKWEQEELGHGLYQIVITEIPYQVQKSKLIETIANLLRDKKIPLVSNIRDESTEDIRIILEPKSRSINSEQLMESMFKQTDLEIRFNYNMNVIASNGLPRVMNLKEILSEFINHRFNIITRRSQYEKNKIDARLEILTGLKIAYLNLDEIIKIIREEDEPKPILMQKFSLSDVQAEAILNTKLRSLRKLEEQELDAEYSKLSKRRKFLCDILEKESVCWKEVKGEIVEICTEFGKETKLGKRRTLFVEAGNIVIPPVNIEAYIEKELITVIFSKQGWIRANKGTIEDEQTLKFKEGDEYSASLRTYTTDHILFATKSGKFYTILANSISKGKGFGDSIRMMIDMAANDEIIGMFIYNKDDKFVLCSKRGKGFIVEGAELFAQTKNGKQIMNCQDEDFCLKALALDPKYNMIACSSSERKILIFPLTEIPTLKKGQGVNLMKLNNGHLADAKLFSSETGFDWHNSKEKKTQQNFSVWSGKRAGSGKPAPFGFSKQGIFGS